VGVAVIVGVLVSPQGVALRPVPAYTVPWGQANDHLQHIVTVVMENRVYDQYFGEYCLTLGPYCSWTGNGIPAGTCVPFDPRIPTGPCVKPYNLTPLQYVEPDMPHNWNSGVTAWDNGAMDGFYAAEGGGSAPFGHFNGSTIPTYWDLAEQYAISDNMFAGNLSYSLPNHWYLLAGRAPNLTQMSYISDTKDRAAYINESNQVPTIQDALNRTGTSWKYYDWSLDNRSTSLSIYNPISDGSAFSYWNPLAAQAETYAPHLASHYVPRADFLSDAQNGSLPSVSWVIPDWTASDHPPENVTDGEAFVAQLVNAVESGPDWSSTAIFVVWDDYGGFYDHVAPASVHQKLLSFRSPTIVIGPYAKENYISHAPLDFFSLLRFVEWQFRLGCVARLDCSASMPWDFFNFNQTARPPMRFTTIPSEAVYPMALQGPNAPNLLCRGCVAASPAYWADNGTDEGDGTD
jgi:phospholipase C